MAIFWKEWRELRIAALALALVGVLVGFCLKLDNDAAMGMVVAVGLLGGPLGAWQGFLDRRAAQDEFLLHRPMSAARLHTARAAAGVVAALTVAIVPLAVMLFVPYRRGLPVVGSLLDPAPDPQWSDVTGGRVAFAVLVCAAMWAVARLGASARGPLAAAICGLLMPATLSFALMRVSGSPAAAATLVGGALVVAAGASREMLSLRSEGRNA